MKNILLFNTSFKNKGDALMNAAIISEIGPHNTWMVPASLAFTSPRESKGFKISLCSDLPGVTVKQKVFNVVVGVAGRFATLLPRKLINATRFVPIESLDIALDVSGYCYGDVWGQRRVEHGRAMYKRFSAAGVKVVLMPKTWGPFEKITKSSVNEMLRHVDLVFARDKTSKALLDNLVDVSVASKLAFSPDYTHGIGRGEAVSSEVRKVGYLIPSYRVIDSGVLTQDAYIQLMGLARQMFVDGGLAAKLLIHETSNDLRFIELAGQMGFHPSDIVVVDDPLDLKREISRASAVVTSRLHGLYNALNSAVPVAVVAWSFKYREALEQYGCLESLVDLARAEESLKGIVSLMLDDAGSTGLKAEMHKGRAASAKQTKIMWDRIRDVLNLGANECDR